MHTHRCVLVELSMEIGMLNFWLGLLFTALMKETYFKGCVEMITTFIKLIFDPDNKLKRIKKYIAIDVLF